MQVPKARKLPSGSWFIQMRLSGESIPVTARSEKECINQAMLIKAQHKAEDGARKRADRRERKDGPTLRQAVDRYIAVRSNTLSPSTIGGYTTIQRTRFKGVMDSPLRSISNWQAVCNAEAKLISAKTLKNAWLFIVSVLREQGIDAPKVKLPQVIQKDKAYLEPDQIPIFLSAIKGKACEIPALLALHSLRRSEIWAMPEIENGVIKVRGAVVQDKDHKMTLKPTNKNSTSRRDVPVMIPQLAEAIKERGDKPLFTQNPNEAYKQIIRICGGVGLPLVGIHGLRHSFASLAYHLRVPEAYVMQVGGWSDIGTMRKIYTHLAQKDALKSQNDIMNFFNNANDKC
jgi:integrase